MSVTMDVVDEPVPGLDADGRPDPAYAALLGLVPAPAGRRSAAFALDALVWVAIALPGAIAVAMLAGPLLSGDVGAIDQVPLIVLLVSQGLLVVFGLVQLVLHGRTGRTLGKAAFRLRSVNVATFGVPGFWRVVLRAFALWGSQLVMPVAGPALMFASSGWDPERRGRSWLDRVGSCYVVDIRAGLDPLDAKALRHARRAAAQGPVTDAPRLPSLASDRPVGGELFIPSARSSSGVVSATVDDVGAWTPPEIAPTAGAPSSAAAPVPAAAPPPTTRWVLVFDDGAKVVAAASGLLGRGPAPAPGEHADQLVPLLDETMRVSKTHAAYGVDAAGFWIADRASRNGVVVTLPDGASRTLAPRTRTPLPAGATVTLGGRSFTVTQDSGR